ncbi:MAG: hypothetical protein H7Y31_06165, partial [Chitinophagaceae bacterium]|nr:hypothetical protein [Chitinophagaceae bacterium]
MSCNDKNILEREGTSAITRMLEALSVNFVKPDERDTADLLLFAKRYGAYLNYYNESNSIDGDWQSLMKMDISVTLATLMKIDLNAIATYRKLLTKRIRISGSDADAKKQFKFLFDLLFTLIRLIDEQYELIGSSSETKAFIRNSISGKMRPPFVVLDKLFEEFTSAGWLDLSLAGLDGEAPMSIISCSDFDKNNLQSKTEWGIPIVDPVYTGITLPSSADVKENIECIVNHNIFNAHIDSLLKGIAEIIQRASSEFDRTIIDFPDHSPHYALFISFVKLFRHAQHALNSFTQRHLDFYYKDTLQLVNKPATPDAAHLVFELQKTIDKHLLSKGTLFKGGKDSIGKELTYELSDDIVLNKAVVSQIHSQQMLHPAAVLQASPIAASDDGAGAPIQSGDQSWFTFGDARKAKAANSGFAIASNLLLMKEGERRVSIIVS